MIASPPPSVVFPVVVAKRFTGFATKLVVMPPPSTTKSPFTLVVDPDALKSTSPPASVVFPVVVAKTLTSFP